MSHPDEGTIQMLLDGELDPGEQSRVEAHIGSCAPCAARLAEARTLLGEADRLVAVLVVPTTVADRPRAPGRRTVARTLAWAASIMVAVGVGYWGRGPNPPAPQLLQDTAAVPAVTTPLVPAAPTVPRAGGAVSSVDPAVASDRGAASREEAKAATQQVNGFLEPGPAPAAERERLDAPANAAAKVARQADERIATWRVISMEDAVRLLGGQIRLIDGLTPDRVETGPGTAVAGADAADALVRIVYASGVILLDQQRTTTLVEARSEDAASVLGAAAPAAHPTGWQMRDGIRIVVTGNLSADSLRILTARVR